MRDVGVWSRYVGDASRLLDVSVHSDGWGNYPDRRLADGAAALRDFVAEAWTASATMPVGYRHPVTAPDVDAKRAVPTCEAVAPGD